jgi:hypothetical protein
MPSKNIDPVRAATSQVAHAVKRGDAEGVIEAQRQLHVARILRAVNNAIHGEYAITDEQRAELARFILVGRA